MRTLAYTAERPRRLNSRGKYCLRVCLSLVLGGPVLLGVPAPALAFDESTKSDVLLRYQAARGYYEQRRYPEAAAEFSRALETIPLPVLALWAARCHALAGNLVAAKAAYLDAIRLKPNELWLGDKQQRAQANATRELAELRQRLAPTAPEPAREQHAKSVSSSWRTVGWVGVSVGGVALAFGAVTGLILRSRHESMDPDCPRGTCNPAVVSSAQVNEHNNLLIASSIGFVAGGVLSAIGLTLILATPTHETKPEVVLRITPGGPVVQGAF